MKMDRSGGVESEGRGDRMRNETAFRSAPREHRSKPPLVCCTVCHFYKHSAQVSIMLKNMYSDTCLHSNSRFVKPFNNKCVSVSLLH